MEGDVIRDGKEELEEMGCGVVRMKMNREGGGKWGEMRKGKVGKGIGMVVDGVV